MEVSDTLEHVDNIINMPTKSWTHMDGFSAAEEAWLSSITETLRTWRYVMHKTYESPEDNKQRLASSSQKKKRAPRRNRGLQVLVLGTIERRKPNNPQ